MCEEDRQLCFALVLACISFISVQRVKRSPPPPTAHHHHLLYKKYQNENSIEHGSR